MKIETKLKIVIAIWIGYFLIALSGTAGIVYVAWHFLRKLW